MTVNNKIVYVGKSKNILYRMAEHWISMANPKENKYKVLSEARSRKYKIRFNILHTASSRTMDEIDEEIGEREGYFIRLYTPPLNYQIPKEENWRKFKINRGALNISLD
ncbi:MAG: GIY-YIG nuclease family protein [Clostridia bacterium]|nr:GIY-YIG nuclease family protein [Clostridia bacterium]